MTEIKGTNLTFHVGEVTRADRERVHGHKGGILWFTGLSGSGKSTLSHRVERKLLERGVFTSHGDFYAQTVVERLGVEGLVRAGCACYTTMEEVERLLDGVREIAG